MGPVEVRKDEAKESGIVNVGVVDFKNWSLHRHWCRPHLSLLGPAMKQNRGWDSLRCMLRSLGFIQENRLLLACLESMSGKSVGSICFHELAGCIFYTCFFIFALNIGS